jgi:hypothetical protein
MIQSVLGVLKRLPNNSRSFATTAGTLKTKGPSPSTGHRPGHLPGHLPGTTQVTDVPDCFQRVLNPPKAPPALVSAKPSGDPSLDKELRPRIAALFGPSRRAPLKPTPAQTASKP